MNIITWDIRVFEFINQDLSNVVFDFCLPFLRQPLFWLPLYVFIIGFLFFNFGKKAYWLVVFLILTVGSADMISSNLVKKTVRRLRPCNTEYVQVIKRVKCGVGYSFTSNHASNHFAMSTFLVLTLGYAIPTIKKWLWLWASSVAFAQIYVGVHFPLDVIGGAILGYLLARAWAILYHKYYGYTWINTSKV